MEQANLEHIVNLVTQQVLAAMEQEKLSCHLQADGFSKVLLVGRPGREVPEELRENAVVFDLEDYNGHQNILRYDRVIITDLTITQLADIAQGRIGDEVSCAVLHALLNGIETLMLEDAITFRKFAGKGSTALYQLLEGYAQTLQVFGVKTTGQKPKQVLPEPKPPKRMVPPISVPKGSAVPNASRLVTEAEALLMIKQGGTVHLPADAIITPSAWDVFSQARADLVRNR